MEVHAARVVQAADSLLMLVSELKQSAVFSDFWSLNRSINQRIIKFGEQSQGSEKLLVNIGDEVASSLDQLEFHYYAFPYRVLEAETKIVLALDNGAIAISESLFIHVQRQCYATTQVFCSSDKLHTIFLDPVVPVEERRQDLGRVLDSLGNYLRKRSIEQDFDGGEVCEVISTLTHDLTKARNQLVRLMHQLKPGGGRLYGGYNGPRGSLRLHTACAGSNPYSCDRTPASGRFECGKENPHRKNPSPRPQRPCRPTTAPGANQFGHPQQRAPFAKQGDKRLQRRVSYSCERPQEEEQPQQCNRNDMTNTSGMSDLSDTSDMNGQSDSTCLNITFDSPEPAPVLCQRCRCNTNTSRSSIPVCLKGSCDLPRLQGGGSDLVCFQQGRGRRYDMGTQFAAQLNDITSQLRERRLGANPVKKF